MNLTKTAKYTKIGVIVFGVIVAFYYFSILLLIPAGKMVWKQIFPPKNPPTLAYGKLEPLKMTGKQIINKEPRYTLNTKNGALPQFPDRATVYKFREPPYSLNAGRTASQDAEKLYMYDQNLSSNVEGDIYRWVLPETATNLTIQIYSRDLILTNALSDTNLLSAKIPPNSIDQNRALGKFNNLLNEIGRYNDEMYPFGNQFIVLGKFNNGRIRETTSNLEAQIARVDIFRSIEKLPIYGPTYRKGLLHGIVANPLPGNENLPLNFLSLELYFHQIDQNSDATYPIVDIQTAWQEVSKNKGVISEVVPRGSSAFDEYIPVSIEKIFINNIKLAYYETPEKQKFLQPIYVFEGNYSNINGEGGNIYIYYPAIQNAYYESGQSLVLGMSDQTK